MCRGGGNFPYHPENIGTIRKLSRLSENFPGYPETFRTIRKISGLSVNLSRLSGNFPDHSENIQTIRKLSRPSWQFGNFPDGLETSQCNFKGYAQKLSGRAKTFRMAMPRCHDGFWASGGEGFKKLVTKGREQVGSRAPLSDKLFIDWIRYRYDIRCFSSIRYDIDTILGPQKRPSF